MAAVDYFLKIDGIPGESGDYKHKGEIELLSWNWGETQSGTFAHGGGGGAGKVAMKDFHFNMTVNQASGKLLLACATGDHIKSAVLTCRKAGKEQQEYLKITLENVLVSSYETSGSLNTSHLPVDEISLNFAKITYDYKKQNEKGQIVPGALVAYDLKAMKAG
jgi:type VI secretion system secreted protein Hcp